MGIWALWDGKPGPYVVHTLRCSIVQGLIVQIKRSLSPNSKLSPVTCPLLPITCPLLPIPHSYNLSPVTYPLFPIPYNLYPEDRNLNRWNHWETNFKYDP